MSVAGACRAIVYGDLQRDEKAELHHEQDQLRGPVCARV